MSRPIYKINKVGLCSLIACVNIMLQSICHSLEEGLSYGVEAGVRMTI